MEEEEEAEEAEVDVEAVAMTGRKKMARMTRRTWARRTRARMTMTCMDKRDKTEALGGRHTQPSLTSPEQIVEQEDEADEGNCAS